MLHIMQEKNSVAKQNTPFSNTCHAWTEIDFPHP